MKRLIVMTAFFGLMAASTVLSAQTASPAPQAVPGGPPVIAAANTTASPSGWKAPCFEPDCNPGGKGVPSETPAQTFGVASPSTSGSSMLLTLTTETPSKVGHTNALWTWFAPKNCDMCTKLVSHFKLQPGLNADKASSYEADTFLFDKTDGLDFMWGLQCNQSNKLWQIDNQHDGWVDTSIPCSLSPDKFHDIVFTVHRIPGDTSCTGGMPCLYFDSLSIDGTNYDINQTMRASPLKKTWGSRIGNQFQIDSSGKGASSGHPLTTTLYVDESDFQASY